MKKIRYKELSIPVKMAIIGGWIMIASMILNFLIGFFKGLTGIAV